MARGKTDQEVLAISRASKHLEDLEDPRAQARVASYLYMRFTAAGESILQSEDRAALAKVDERQIALPFVAAPGPTLPHTATAGGVPPAAVQGAAAPTGGGTAGGGASRSAPGSAPVAPQPAGRPETKEETAARLDRDWGLKEEDGAPPTAAKPTNTKAKPNASGGWDLKEEEVEVKI